MTIVAFALLAILLPLTIFDLFRRPTIRRLGLRNLTRRRGEAVLVVGGSMLATALITASFVIGDSFDHSIRNIAETRLGPIDEIVGVSSTTDAEAVVTAIQTADLSDIDGVMAVHSIDVAAGSVGDNRIVEPTLRYLELDQAAATSFGGEPGATGLSGWAEPLGPTEVMINEGVASDLGLEAGDTIEVFAAGVGHQYTVVDVMPTRGLAGLGDIIGSPGSLTLKLPTAEHLSEPLVVVSNRGDVYGGSERTDTVVSQLATLLPDDTNVSPAKQDLLAAADAEGQETTYLFGTIGGFSVIAGILLVVNLFAMLAAERRTDIGTMRAIGIRQGTIVRSFALEGAAYGLLAAIAGAVTGVGVGATVVAYANRTLAEGSPFSITTSIVPASLLSGAVIGFAISQLTVIGTCLRSTRLTIVRAIKDIGEDKHTRGRRRGLIVGGLGVALATAGLLLASDKAIIALGAPVLACVALIPYAKLVVPPRIATFAGCVAGLIWASAVFSILPKTMDNPDVDVFLLQGVLLVGLASVLVTNLDHVWLAITSRMSGGSIGAKLGLAHPLDRPVRSVMLVAMFALVLFTVSFMSILNAVFLAQGPSLAERAGGGYEVIVDTNQSSGYDADELRATPGIDVVTPIARSWASVHTLTGAEATTDSPFDDGPVSMIQPGFELIDPPSTTTRDVHFATDADAWAAVAAGPESDGTVWIIAPDDLEVTSGDTILLEGPSGRVLTATVAGTSEQQWLVEAGIFLGLDAAPLLYNEPVTPTRFYASIAGRDAETIAQELTAGSPERGVDASTFLSNANDELAGQDSFIKMLQGYLGLGLVIGIVGLGVVLTRAVRERRREIGMLRAMGIARSQIRSMFVVEAAFIGAQGVVLGIGLGTLSSWQLVSSGAIETGLDFMVPFTALTIIGVVSLTLALLAAAVPAARAGRETPAAALRVAA